MRISSIFRCGMVWLAQAAIFVTPARGQTTRPAPFVAGRVVSMEGQVVAGAKVLVYDIRDAQYDMPPFATATSDAQGIFKLPCPAVTFSLFVQASGMGLFATNPPPTIGDDRMEIMLRPATTIRLRATDAAGKPVAGVEMTPNSVQGPRGYIALPTPLGRQLFQKSGPDGICLFPDMPRDGRVIFSIPGLSLGCSVETTDADLVQAEASPVQNEVMIEGRIVCADTGEPVPNVRVNDSIETQPNSFTGASAFAGADGRFRILMTHGGIHRIACELGSPLSGEYFSPKATLTLAANEHVKDVVIKLEKGMLLHGKVTSVSGTPIDGAQIALFDSPENMGYTGARTGLDGTYALELPAGQYKIFARNLFRSGYLLPADNLRAVTLDVAHQETVVDFQCAPNPAPWVKGQVVDEQGMPISGADVVTRATGGEFDGNIDFSKVIDEADGSARTDSNGKFLIPFVSSPARLTVMKDNARLAEAINITAANRDLKITLPKPSAGSLVMHAVDQEGNPLADVQVIVRWRDDALSGEKSGPTDADGAFRVDGLFTYFKYNVEASLKGHTSAQVSNLAVPANGENDSITLRLYKADGFITGKIIGENGLPIANMNVQIMGMPGRANTAAHTSAVTDANGQFRLDGLVGGTVVGIGVRVSLTANSSMFRVLQQVPVGTENVVLTYHPPATQPLRGRGR